MADETTQTDQQEAGQGRGGVPFWMTALIGLIGIVAVYVTLFFLMNHVREAYVVPYYQLRYEWEQKVDSLEAAIAAGVPTGLEDEIALYRGRSDSLAVVASQNDQQLEELTGQVEQFEQEQQQLTDKDIKRLAGIFGAMKAPRAASIMANMDRDTIVEVLMMINQRNAAKIMAAMPTEMAAGVARQIQRRAEAKSGG